MSSTWLHDLIARLRVYLPDEAVRVAVAAGVVLLGYLVASLARFVACRLLRRVSARLLKIAHRASDRRGLEPPVDAAEAESATVAVAGRIVFWLVFVLFLGTAMSVLGFAIVSSWLELLAGYLPRVLASAVIVLLGVLSGHLLRVVVTAAADSAGMARALSLGRAAQIAVVVLAAVVAIEELGIGVTFLVVISATVLGAILGGVALAFGLGARTAVGNLVSCHYLSKWFQVGQVIRIGSHQGRIAEILPTAVVLRTDAGKVFVPASEFASRESVLLLDEDAG